MVKNLLIKNKEVDNSSESFDFWDKLKYLFSNPNLFFEKIKSEKGIKNALLTFVIVGFFASVISYGISFGTRFFLPYGRGFFGFPLGYFGLLGYGFLGWLSPIIGFLSSILISFIYSGIIYAIIIAFKGEGTFLDTYKVYAYSMVPFLILKLIPLIGYLSIIYSFILMIIGISKLHNISKGKAALACLLPVIFVIGSLILFVIIYLRFFWRGFF